jgi:hypothetical protein
MILQSGLDVDFDTQELVLTIYELDDDDKENLIYLDEQGVRELRDYLNTLNI